MRRHASGACPTRARGAARVRQQRPEVYRVQLAVGACRAAELRHQARVDWRWVLGGSARRQQVLPRSCFTRF